MLLREKQLRRQSSGPSGRVARTVCNTHVQRDVVAALGNRHEMIERHLQFGDPLAADVAPAPVALVDRGRVYLLDDSRTLSDASSALTLRTFFGMLSMPSVRHLSSALRVLFRPTSHLNSRLRGVRRVPRLGVFLPAFATIRRETVGPVAVGVELVSLLRDLALRALRSIRDSPVQTTIMSMDEPHRFAPYPVALPVCPGGDRRFFPASTGALHGGRILGRMWFK